MQRRGARAFVLLVLMAGCAARQAFRPAGELGVTPEGTVPGLYDVGGTLGTVARVTVRVPAAYEGELGGRERTLVQVVFTIHNRTGAVLRPALDDLRVEARATDERRGPVAVVGAPIAVPSDVAVRPFVSQDVSVTFALPANLDPGRLQELRVSWTLRFGEQGASHVTRFVPELAYDVEVDVDVDGDVHVEACATVDERTRQGRSPTST